MDVTVDARPMDVEPYDEFEDYFAQQKLQQGL